MCVCLWCRLLPQGPLGSTIIRRSIQGMLEELEYNLWEAILVRLVDYGHTVSPELEMAALRCVCVAKSAGVVVCILCPLRHLLLAQEAPRPVYVVL